MKRIEKLCLITGASGIALMAYTAVLSPAEAYELSIYRSTPVSFWVGMAIALLTGILGGVGFNRHRARNITVGVAITALMLFLALPYIRGYFFFGMNDALQHLGWTRDIMLYHTYGNDQYPGLHVLAASISMLTGLEISSALLLVPPFTYLLFVFSLPLLSCQLLGWKKSRLVSIALLLGCLVPTITAVVIPRMQPISTVSAMHITPFILWITFSLTEENRVRGKRFLVCLFPLQISLLMFHPQYLLVVLVMGVVYFGFITVANKFSKQSWRIQQPVVISSVLLPGILLAYWLVTGALLQGALRSIIAGLIYSEGANVANPAGTGLSEVGGSTLTLFLRTLSIQITIGIICVGAGLMALYRVSRRTAGGGSLYEQLKTSEGKQLRMLLACIPVAGLGIVYLVAGDLPQVVRYLCFIAGLGTVIVAIKLISIRTLVSERLFIASVSIFILIGVTVSLPATFASPYLYKPGHHVTETQMSGYEWFFDTADEEPTLAVDTDVSRHYRAIHGNRLYREWLGSDMRRGQSLRGGDLVGAHFDDRQLAGRFPDTPSWYLITSEFSRKQQIELYEGLQFNQSDYDYLDRSERISQFYSNGDVRIYQIRSET